MKKIIFLLAIILPVICMGQNVRESLCVMDTIIVIDLPKQKQKALDDIKIESWVKPLEITSSIINDFLFPRSESKPVKRKADLEYSRILFVVNGVVKDHASFSLKDINIENIKSISVLKDSIEVVKYGDEGRSGVILIELKEEYEATVLDPDFDSFLSTQQPIEFFSEAILKAKNTLMVAEWNYRYNQPLRYDPQIYEVKIDYESGIDYGLEVEYKLYMFFKFMEKQHKLLLTI
ncbi:MAG: DUF6146 family protein [Dysgonomonas sp.]